MSAGFGVLWASAILAGVIWFQTQRTERSSSLLLDLAEYEVVHLAAHTILYATLSAALAVALGRAWIAVTMTLVVALAQELVQVRSAHVSFGNPEFFDLGVDLLAAVAGAALLRYLAYRRVRCVPRLTS